MIRVATGAEVAAVLALWKEAEATPSVTDTDAEVTRAIAEPAADVLVVEHDGRVVATLIVGFDGWRGNLYRLAVHPDRRRRGLARALVAEAERRLTARGARRITALVEHDHDDAVGFWTAAGYRHDDRIARYVRTLA